MSPQHPSPLTTLGAGFADPVHGAQQVFRTLLDATSRPGQVWASPEHLGLQAPASRVDGQPWQPATAAALLTLLDAECHVHLVGELASADAASWLRFHTGAHLALAGQAQFCAVRANEATPELLASLSAGSEEAPQDSATLVIEVAAMDSTHALEDAALLHLSGPGIQRRQGLAVRGLSPAFWHARQQQQTLYPQGVDLLLCCGHRVAALPRSTLLDLEF